MKRRKPDILLVLAIVLGIGIVSSGLSMALEKDNSTQRVSQLLK